MKFDVRDTYADPSEESRDRGEILEPFEDGSGATGAAHVRQE